ncbi:MAG: 50S ribosomal protein L10 [Parcubacteria group bacterium GW2011_GWA2_44_13]|nr:MAG: 50S ribosomal protein L10 [Parcubacteria group bacterium GW2011_GWA2_44_13]
MVAKKTLLGVAAKELGLEIDKKKLEGEVAMTVSSQGEDMVLAIAKEIVIFAKKNADMLKIIGGLWNKVWMDQAEIKNLASIPSREVLLTRLAFMLSQPVASLVRVLNSVGEKLKENK